MLVGISLENKFTNTSKPKDCAEEMSALLMEVAAERCKRSYAKVFGYVINYINNNIMSSN